MERSRPLGHGPIFIPVIDKWVRCMEGGPSRLPSAAAVILLHLYSVPACRWSLGSLATGVPLQSCPLVVSQTPRQGGAPFISCKQLAGHEEMIFLHARFFRGQQGNSLKDHSLITVRAVSVDSQGWWCPDHSFPLSSNRPAVFYQ